MRRGCTLGTALFGILLALALPGAADEKVKVTIKEYRKQREASANREAYERASLRLKGVRLGMRSDEFFAQMEMLVIRDKKGRGIDGFCDGHLPQESLDMSRGREPAHLIVFGWYQDWKKSKDPVRKFYVLFRDNILREIAFFDPADDTDHLSGKVE